MMNCTTAQSWLFRKIDGELSDSENTELDAHLSKCTSCGREYRLLILPYRIAQATVPPTASPFFYQKLRMRIEAEAPKVAGWQTFRGLVRSMVPTLAGITLALLSVFAYLQIRGPQTDLYRSYEGAFISEDQIHGMLIADQKDITYESVLRVIAEQESNYRRNQNLK
jgi:hypothetical protein